MPTMIDRREFNDAGELAQTLAAFAEMDCAYIHDAQGNRLNIATLYESILTDGSKVLDIHLSPIRTASALRLAAKLIAIEDPTACTQFDYEQTLNDLAELITRELEAL